jgi:hypothetical protein
MEKSTRVNQTTIKCTTLEEGHLGFQRIFWIRSGETFRPSTKEARVKISRHLLEDSTWGIIRAHFQSPEGAQPPGGYHLGFIQSFSEPIFHPKDIRRNLEDRAHNLGQISGRLVEYSHQGEYIYHL